MSDRDEFEHWFREGGHPRGFSESINLERRNDGEYLYSAVEHLWQAWQAARRWRPIEEARLEQNSELLVCDKEGQVWLVCVERFDDTPEDGMTGYGFYTHDGIDVSYATHFQYPPEPPNE